MNPRSAKLIVVTICVFVFAGNLSHQCSALGQGKDVTWKAGVGGKPPDISNGGENNIKQGN